MEVQEKVSPLKCSNDVETKPLPAWGILFSHVFSFEWKILSYFYFNLSFLLLYQEEKEKKIRELTAELESTNQRCEVYRANLLAVLRDMEEQKLKLSVKVQNARLSLKE